MRYYFYGKYEEPKSFSYKITEFTGVDASKDPDKLPLNSAVYGYNIRFTGGVLREAPGVGYARINERYVPGAIATGEGIKKLFLYKRFLRSTGERKDRLIFYSDNQKLYATDLATGTSFQLLNVQLGTDNLTFLNCEYDNKDVLFISDDRGHLVLYDGTNVQTIDDTPYFSDACVYNGRVYATSGTGNNVLYFSAQNDPTAWSDASGAGYVTFPDDGGKLLRVIPFKDALIVFREHSVYKYVGYPNSSAFTLAKIFSTEQPIYSNSACACGEKLIFFTGNGFYKYEGGTVTKIWRNLFPLIDAADHCSGCFFDNKYYFTCRMKTDLDVVGEETNVVNNNAVFAIDVYGGEYSITRGTDVAEFIPAEYKGETKLFCRFSYGYRVFDIGMITETGKVFSTALKKLWRSPKTALSSLGEKKFLKKIFMRSCGAIQLNVETSESAEYELPSGARVHCAYVGKKADAVGLTLTTTADTFTVYGMEMEFETQKRGIYDRQ